jgi:hypothetical protein
LSQGLGCQSHVDLISKALLFHRKKRRKRKNSKSGKGSFCSFAVDDRQDCLQCIN